MVRMSTFDLPHVYLFVAKSFIQAFGFKMSTPIITSCERSLATIREAQNSFYPIFIFKSTWPSTFIVFPLAVTQFFLLMIGFRIKFRCRQ